MRIKNQRLSSEDVQFIRKLTDEGKSLGYLSKLINVGKSTIYYQVRKFKPRIKKEFKITLNDFQIGELIGAFAGDGSYNHRRYDARSPLKGSHYKINYYLTYPKEEMYALHIKKLLVSLNLNPFSYIREGTMMIGVNSKEYSQFVKSYLVWGVNKTLTIRLKEEKKNSSEFLNGFARGLMDTDGYVEVSNVSCACISKDIIKDLTDVFDENNLKYKVTERRREGKNILFLVRVYRGSLEEYKQTIGFSNVHKVYSLNRILEKKSVSIKKPNL